MSFWNQVKQLIPFANVNKWSIWTMHWSKKRPERTIWHVKVILQHNNAPPHTAKAVRDTISALGWEVLHLPPYSPDLGLHEYHLLSSISHPLNMKHFNNYWDVEKWFDDLTSSKGVRFSERASINCRKDGKNVWLAMAHTRNEPFLTFLPH